ncbi:MAG: nucleotidyltransferase domain-containing protein [Chloroflexota bacterium]|nr:nucleotidyltransferase domain-containing protein [Chloroflexota bacterium]
MNAEIQQKLADIRDLCEKHGIRALYLFGSATRGDFDSSSSDFDFLVEFQTTAPGTNYGYRYLDFADELEQLMGRSIDLLTTGSRMNRYLREEIEETREELFRAPDPLAA